MPSNISWDRLAVPGPRRATAVPSNGLTSVTVTLFALQKFSPSSKLGFCIRLDTCTTPYIIFKTPIIVLASTHIICGMPLYGYLYHIKLISLIKG